MATAQQLIDLSTELTQVVKSINVIVGKQPLPYNLATASLSNAAFMLAAQANSIGQAGIDALAADVQAAIGQLSGAVSQAQQAIAKLADVQKALNIVSAVLSAAAGISASVATGNWIGAAGDVVGLATKIQAAVNNNQ